MHHDLFVRNRFGGHRHIFSSDSKPFSCGVYSDILLSTVVSINPHRRLSDDHRVTAQAASKKDGLAAHESCICGSWRRLVKSGASGSLSTETLMPLRWLTAV